MVAQIKKLAFEICKLNDSEINDDLLQNKRKKSNPVARARITAGESSSAPTFQRSFEEQVVEGRSADQQGRTADQQENSGGAA